MKKTSGHYCQTCGRRRANEKFSRKGHALHICKDCHREQQAERRAQKRESLRGLPHIVAGNAESANADFRRAVQEYLAKFYAEYPDADLARRAAKALRFIASADQPLKGAAAGWAGGIVYALGSWLTPGMGIPNVFKHDLKRIFGVSDTTIRNRAAAVREELSVFPEITMRDLTTHALSNDDLFD